MVGSRLDRNLSGQLTALGVDRPLKELREGLGLSVKEVRRTLAALRGHETALEEMIGFLEESCAAMRKLQKVMEGEEGRLGTGQEEEGGKGGSVAGGGWGVEG